MDESENNAAFIASVGSVVIGAQSSDDSSCQVHDHVIAETHSYDFPKWGANSGSTRRSRSCCTERDRFAEDLAGLDDAAWQAPSLCLGWTVRDLCAHLLMPCEREFGSFIVGLAQARLNFDKTADR
ncbi:MAG: maleylpyruvate isomerase family mycothiol-dependent enzyme [Salinibacterium sp.]|nr:maleylpyruvate isomerase family mycothiol-dependent enzyme [Salinibacterium sp.]